MTGTCQQQQHEFSLQPKIIYVVAEKCWVYKYMLSRILPFQLLTVRNCAAYVLVDFMRCDCGHFLSILGIYITAYNMQGNFIDSVS